MDDLHRYHRQMLLPGVGEEGQRLLRESRVLIVGCGALGCAAADLIVRAGVGTVVIIDRDVVEPTNLQRQSLFDESDVAEGLPKAEAARRRLRRINSNVTVEAAVADFNAASAGRLAGVDSGRVPGVIIDGTDNFETRYLLNDLAVKHGVPYAYGGVIGTRGMAMTVLPGKTACLRCIFEEIPPPGSVPTCDTAGVLGPAVQIVAACQAGDALKVLLGRGDLVARSLLEFDLWSNRRRRVETEGLRDRAGCVCCGSRRFEFLEGGIAGATASLCGRNSVQVLPGRDARVDLQALAARLGPHGTFQATPFLVRGTLKRSSVSSGDGLGLTVFADGRAIVHGTDRPEVARSMYARYVGV